TPLAFAGIGVALIATGFLHAAHGSSLLQTAPSALLGSSSSIVAITFAFPVAMALATGVEAPSSAIAPLGQLDQQGRKRFGRITLWLKLVIVGGLTYSITALYVSLGNDNL